MGFETLIGGVAAFMTTASYVPQLKKTWQTGDTGDLSLKMLITLGCGLSLWIVYGIMQSDPIIIAANALSVAMIACLAYLKLSDTADQDGHGTQDERSN